ncbi:hypothetical protein [Haloplasma contractile]|uniref:Uncharacterized protein n=1 Tax=Haloplasma contractile SSD-17B TaxID=1033810 RepID=F7PRG0_9MOLU|nr:hypothetical protein [Haloplasma contractile]ERJ11713.1 hypothetical protein HLPCO_002196 [Haloplasma contractile SSD-17B]
MGNWSQNLNRTKTGPNRYGIAATITIMVALLCTGIYIGWSLLELVDHQTNNVIRMRTTSVPVIFFLNLAASILSFTSLFFCKKQTEINYNLTIHYIEVIVWILVVFNILHFIWGFFNGWFYLT